MFTFILCFQRLVLYQGLKKIPAENRQKLVNTLNVLDGFLSKSKWLAGNEITIADFSILGTITTVKVCESQQMFNLEVFFALFFPPQEFGYDLAKHPNLNDWYTRCQTFPGFQENFDGAKYLAERMFTVLDDKF